MRWCSWGCGAEVPVDKLKDGACPKCGGSTVDLGWRYRDNRHDWVYTSTYDTLPADVKRATVAA